MHDGVVVEGQNFPRFDGIVATLVDEKMVSNSESFFFQVSGVKQYPSELVCVPSTFEVILGRGVLQTSLLVSLTDFRERLRRWTWL